MEPQPASGQGRSATPPGDVSTPQHNSVARPASSATAEAQAAATASAIGDGWKWLATGPRDLQKCLSSLELADDQLRLLDVRASSDVECLTAQVQSMRASHTAIGDLFLHELYRARNAILALSHQRKATQDSFRNDVQETKAQCSDLRQKLTVVESHNSELQQSLDVRMTELSTVQADLQRFRSEYIAHEQEKEAKYQHERALLSSEIEQLRKQLNQQLAKQNEIETEAQNTSQRFGAHMETVTKKIALLSLRAGSEETSSPTPTRPSNFQDQLSQGVQQLETRIQNLDTMTKTTCGRLDVLEQATEKSATSHDERTRAFHEELRRTLTKFVRDALQAVSQNCDSTVQTMAEQQQAAFKKLGTAVALGLQTQRAFCQDSYEGHNKQTLDSFLRHLAHAEAVAQDALSLKWNRSDDHVLETESQDDRHRTDSLKHLAAKSKSETLANLNPDVATRTPDVESNLEFDLESTSPMKATKRSNDFTTSKSFEIEHQGRKSNRREIEQAASGASGSISKVEGAADAILTNDQRSPSHAVRHVADEALPELSQRSRSLFPEEGQAACRTSDDDGDGNDGDDDSDDGDGDDGDASALGGDELEHSTGRAGMGSGTGTPTQSNRKINGSGGETEVLVLETPALNRKVAELIDGLDGRSHRITSHYQNRESQPGNDGAVKYERTALQTAKLGWEGTQEHHTIEDDNLMQYPQRRHHMTQQHSNTQRSSQNAHGGEMGQEEEIEDRKVPNSTYLDEQTGLTDPQWLRGKNNGEVESNNARGGCIAQSLEEWERTLRSAEKNLSNDTTRARPRHRVELKELQPQHNCLSTSQQHQQLSTGVQQHQFTANQQHQHQLQGQPKANLAQHTQQSHEYNVTTDGLVRQPSRDVEPPPGMFGLTNVEDSERERIFSSYRSTGQSIHSYEGQQQRTNNFRDRTGEIVHDGTTRADRETTLSSLSSKASISINQRIGEQMTTNKSRRSPSSHAVSDAAMHPNITTIHSNSSVKHSPPPNFHKPEPPHRAPSPATVVNLHNITQSNRSSLPLSTELSRRKEGVDSMTMRDSERGGARGTNFGERSEFSEHASHHSIKNQDANTADDASITSTSVGRRPGLGQQTQHTNPDHANTGHHVYLRTRQGGSLLGTEMTGENRRRPQPRGLPAPAVAPGVDGTHSENWISTHTMIGHGFDHTGAYTSLSSSAERLAPSEPGVVSSNMEWRMKMPAGAAGAWRAAEWLDGVDEGSKSQSDSTGRKAEFPRHDEASFKEASHISSVRPSGESSAATAIPYSQGINVATASVGGQSLGQALHQDYRFESVRPQLRTPRAWSLDE